MPKTTTYRTVAWLESGEIKLDHYEDTEEGTWKATLRNSERNLTHFVNDDYMLVEATVIEEEDGSFTIT